MSPTLSPVFRQCWIEESSLGEEGAPLVSLMFVLSHGTVLTLVDLRDSAEASGVLGYIPGSVFLSVDAVMDRLSPNEPVVFVSKSGVRAARAALRLEQEGWSYVAAMAGGLVGWRRLGLMVSRDPTGVRTEPFVPSESDRRPMSRERVEEHIGDPRNVRWIKTASMVTYGHFSCIDGRDERGVIGTLGGDAGVFLLTLGAVEQVTGTTLDDPAVAQWLTDHVDAFGEFYMHSDMSAFASLVAAMRDHPMIAASIDGRGSSEDVFESIRNPDSAIQDALLNLLIDPDHVGCGHLRLMLQHSDEYGVRRGLVESFIRAFYRGWWAGMPEIRPTLLPGDHDEVAVLNIRLDHPIWGPVPIPRVSPAVGGRQMFINHPDVAAYLCHSFLRYHSLGPHSPIVGPDQLESVHATLERLAAAQLSATLGHLAGDLPIYDVVFGRDGTFSVTKR